MSWALFWFLCVVGFSIALARSQKEVTMLTMETRRRKRYCDGFSVQVQELLETRYRLKKQLDKYKQVVIRRQHAVTKLHDMNTKYISELTAMTIERDQLRVQLEEKNKKRGDFLQG